MPRFSNAKLDVIYRLECRGEPQRIRYLLSCALRNSGTSLIRFPGFAVDIAMKGFSSVLTPLPWWKRNTDDWQPVISNASRSFHTWSDPNMIIYPGTQVCVLSEWQVASSSNGSGVFSAVIEMYAYGQNFSGHAELILDEATAKKIFQDALCGASESAEGVATFSLNPTTFRCGNTPLNSQCPNSSCEQPSSRSQPQPTHPHTWKVSATK